MTRRRGPPRYVRHEDAMRKNMRDPRFREAYEQRKLVHEVAIAVRALRERNGLTQQQLAKRIGVSQPVIGRLERGIGYRTPSWETMRKIFRALGYQLTLQLTRDEPAALLELEGRPPRPGLEAAEDDARAP